jgi:arylsulfatase A-like enzyme
MTSIKFLKFVYISSFMVVLISCNPKEAQTLQKKPNIIFILVDDLGLHDLNVTGSTFYETPNVDRIANEGTVFTQGYAASRVCSPSRASIMLGQFTARHQITDWIGAKSGVDWRALNRNNKLLPAAYNHILPQKDTTLAEALAEHGYKTFFAGKWHLGAEGSWPTDHGFEINKGGWDKGSPIGGFFSPWNNPNLENTTTGENLSIRLGNETANFIPIRTVQDNPIYAGLVQQMDDAVGIVMDKLKALGLEENTIIVFTSDNGGVASGDAFSTTNSPLRGGKGYQWEGGIREPYFIKVPWMSSIKQVGYPVSGTDFYPTLLDLVGIPLKPKQHVDGVSLKPLLEGTQIEDRPLFWHYPHYGNQGGEPASMIREGDWKLIHYWENGQNELYNLLTDPEEQNNVLAQHTEQSSIMIKNLNTFLTSVNANKPEIDSAYDPKLAIKMRQQKIDIMLPQLEAQRQEFLSLDFQPNKNWWGSKMIKD